MHLLLVVLFLAHQITFLYQMLIDSWLFIWENQLFRIHVFQNIATSLLWYILKEDLKLSHCFGNHETVFPWNHQEFLIEEEQYIYVVIISTYLYSFWIKLRNFFAKSCNKLMVLLLSDSYQILVWLNFFSIFLLSS